MSDFVEVANADDMWDGTMRAVYVEGRELLIARVGDTYYAADNVCPHMGGDLSQGVLEGTLVTCPVHHSQFDLTDGHVVAWAITAGIPVAMTASQPRPIKIFEVKIEDGKVWVGGEKRQAAAG